MATSPAVFHQYLHLFAVNELLGGKLAHVIMILWMFKHVQMSDGEVILQETMNLEFNWELSGIRTQRGAVIFQNFINEHNL